MSQWNLQICLNGHAIGAKQLSPCEPGDLFHQDPIFELTPSPLGPDSTMTRTMQIVKWMR